MAQATVNEITVNNIRIGNKAPKSIWKGSTEVKEIRKGNTVVYKKENVTYTLTNTAGGNHAATVTTINFIVQSYKGTNNTPVGISASNVSVTAGGGTVSSVTNTTGYNYNIAVTVAANTSTTSTKTHTIKVTQPVSGNTVTISATQLKMSYYFSIGRVGFRFSGSFPSIGGIECRCTNLNVGGVSVHEDWNGSQAGSGNYGPMGGNCRQITTSSSQGGGTIYYTSPTWNPTKIVYDGSGFQCSFIFGATWSGSTAYQGSTWNMTFSDTYSGKSYIASKTSSMQWQVATQPSGPIGMSTTFQNINAQGKNISGDLVVNVIWTWG